MLSKAEARSYGWYHYYKEQGGENVTETIFLDQSVLENYSVFPKLPYFRDSRSRAMLTKADMAGLTN